MSKPEQEIDLNAEERDALAALPRHRAPAAHLERKTVGALIQEGLLGANGPPEHAPEHSRWKSGLLLLAAAALLLVTGYWVGGLTAQNSEATPATQNTQTAQTTQSLAGGDGERYLLVLFRSEEELANPAGEAELVREYSAWAQDLAQQGHFLGGDPLSADGRLLIPMGTEVETRLQSSQGGEDPMTGYFLIAANDDDQAEEIARRCPHLRHGGKVMIRRLGH